MGCGHSIDKCEHGQTVSQCRCMAKDKPIRIVPCADDCNGSTVLVPPKTTGEMLIKLASLEAKNAELEGEVARLREAAQGVLDHVCPSSLADGTPDPDEVRALVALNSEVIYTPVPGQRDGEKLASTPLCSCAVCAFERRGEGREG